MEDWLKFKNQSIKYKNKNIYNNIFILLKDKNPIKKWTMPP